MQSWPHREVSHQRTVTCSGGPRLRMLFSMSHFVGLTPCHSAPCRGGKAKVASAKDIAAALSAQGENAECVGDMLLRQRRIAPAAASDAPFDAQSGVQMYQLTTVARQRAAPCPP